MNHVYSADRTTHLKVVIVALIAGILVAGFGISMRWSQRPAMLAALADAGVTVEQNWAAWRTSLPPQHDRSAARQARAQHRAEKASWPMRAGSNSGLLARRRQQDGVYSAASSRRAPIRVFPRGHRAERPSGAPIVRDNSGVP